VIDSQGLYLGLQHRHHGGWWWSCHATVFVNQAAKDVLTLDRGIDVIGAQGRRRVG